MNVISNEPPLPIPKKHGRLTHLHKQNKFLKQIPDIISPQYLTTIYLYNNEIEKIEGLEECVNLVCLYLQENRIKIIENLENLRKLKKLFLGHNQISVVENLDENIHLEELHLEKQNVKKCDAMCFDPRTIFALSASLQILDVTGNNIKSLYSLMPLSALRILHAGRNKINRVFDILETIQFWYYLYEAIFTGNPVTKKHRYREQLIQHTTRLTLLDGKQISPITRTFVRNFEAEKKNRVQNNVNLAEVYPELPKNFPKTLQESVSATIIKTGVSDLKLTATPAPPIIWKELPKRTARKRYSVSKKSDTSTAERKSLFPMNL